MQTTIEHRQPAFTNPVTDRERQRREELRASDEHDLARKLPAIEAALMDDQEAEIISAHPDLTKLMVSGPTTAHGEGRAELIRTTRERMRRNAHNVKEC